MSTNFDQILKEAVDSYIKESAPSITKTIQPKIEEELMKIFGAIPQKHEIIFPDRTITINETVHEKFEDVLKVLARGYGAYLHGPAGTGKSEICRQVAKSLGLEFYFTNAVTQEYKLSGFIDAHGHYQETQFYKAFTQGGLFFLDEMDASVPETLTILNAALANGYYDFPVGKIDAHKDFRVIAAGNTIGLGADNNYTGRYCLDRASLDRFLFVDIDYSEAIEKAVSLGKKDLIAFAHAFRTATNTTGIECLCSYRAIKAIADLEDIFDDIHTVLQMALIKGLSKEDVEMIAREMKRKDSWMEKNKYCLGLTGEKKTSSTKTTDSSSGISFHKLTF